ncbi:fibronectin type III-like domain-contianing protein [Paenibacillus sp. H1-7]|uniref:fibronectin type III-like domain-contianing protein n=1 Tax=Paenibacillus sp. H1-7 TaxID=2282849 RepID=UPI001EF86DA6|nr:fibronectin type III-like domain-contianing protein [Paenibacillus sp. H1-7]
MDSIQEAIMVALPMIFIGSLITLNFIPGMPDLTPKAVQQPDGQVKVTCSIENTGSLYGQEVVQLYVHDEECKWVRPEKELKAFAKLGLQPGEKREVGFLLEERDFSYYNTKYNKWVAESGYFQIAVGCSSRDIRIRERLHCDFGREEVSFHKFSLLGDWLSHPKAKIVLEGCFEDMNRHISDKICLDDEFVGFWGDFPAIKVIQMFGQAWLKDRSPDLVIEQLIEQFNRGQQA